MTISDPVRIREIFADTMKGVLGTTNPVLPFDPKVLYRENPDLQSLQAPFSMEEIERSVMQLANNKASGPDGLPNEFLKIYWTDLKEEIFQILSDFYSDRLDLKSFNEATIIMIPKGTAPRTTGEFRPISVIIRFK